MWNNKAVLGNSEIVTLSQNQTGTLLFAILRSDLGGDAADEALDVELGGAGLLAGRVGALEAAAGLPQGGPLAQRRVLYVIKVLEEGRARTEYEGGSSRITMGMVQPLDDLSTHLYLHHLHPSWFDLRHISVGICITVSRRRLIR